MSGPGKLYLSRLQRIYLSQYLKLQFSILSTANTCQAVRVRRNFMMLDAQKLRLALASIVKQLELPP